MKEIGLLRHLLDKNSIRIDFKQVHLGGGSPSYLKQSDLGLLIDKIGTLLDINNLEEFAIEVDPRNITNKEELIYYSKKGVNRLSLGVQDFDIHVQKAVNRIQPPELLENLLEPDIRKLFDSISFDILYGLPNQTLESFRKTIDTLLKFSPDRVSLLCYEHRPDLDVWQNRLKETVFPNKIQKSEMYLNSVNTLVSDGYLQVGLEHFVKPGDSLARAFKMNDLNWNMSGFTPGKGNHIIGIGPSAESRITDDYYFENYSSLPDYESAVEHGRFPICRSYKLNMDDKIRRDVIIKLRNSFSLDFLGIEKEYKIDFSEYFKDEIDKLDEFVGDGLLEINKKMMIISEQGKQFVSFVCRVFDKYA